MRVGHGPHAGRVPARPIIAFVLLVAATVGCHRDPPTEVTMDLADASREATIEVESAAIDFGTEQARRSLGTGWYYDERNRSTGDTFVWSSGPASELYFHLGWRRKLAVEILGRPFEFPGAIRQTVAFELNGRPVGEPVVIDRSPARISLKLPTDFQVEGRNRLVARYGRVDAPSAVVEGSTDERALAFAWSELRFIGVAGGGVSAEPGRFTMPAGPSVNYFPVLSPDSQLVFDACELVGEGPTGFEIEILGETDGHAEILEIPCNGEAVRFSLRDRSGLSRLRMTSGPGELRLLGGRIETAIVPPVEGQPPSQPVTPSAKGPDADTPRPNVIIYLVDALRSDRLGAYGCTRALSPYSHT